MLVQDGGETTIKFRELDISQSKSIQAFSEFLKTEHPEGVDIVINNAGTLFSSTPFGTSRWVDGSID